LPPEINALFGGAAELLAATPEHETPLPGKGSGSHSDVLAFVNMRGARCVVTVEGKVDERFRDTVEAWFKEATTEGSRDNRTKRLDGIYAELGLTNPDTAQIRYQLLHRSAAAVIEAKRFNANCAAMVVQSFSPKHTGFEDFAEFLKLFGIDSAKRDTLYTTHMPGMALHFGWVSSAGAVASAPVSAKPEPQPAQVAEVAAPSPESAIIGKPKAHLLDGWFGWILLVTLVVIATILVLVYKWKKSKQEATVRVGYVDKTVAEVNKEKGDAFERYVHRKFMKRHFSVAGTSDWKVDGNHSVDSKEPDFKVAFQGKMKFAVEAKFTRGSEGGMIRCAHSQKQLKRYQRYQKRTKQNTFIVLGVGEPPDDPRDVYIIPVQKLPKHEMPVEQLEGYKQANRGNFWCNENDLWMMPVQ